MADGVEEEELADHKGLDKHHGACGDDGEETDDVEDSNHIKYDIAWASQRCLVLEERH